MVIFGRYRWLVFGLYFEFAVGVNLLSIGFSEFSCAEDSDNLHIIIIFMIDNFSELQGSTLLCNFVSS